MNTAVEAFIRKHLERLAMAKQEHFVYFATDGGYCKIGMTCDLERRLKELQLARPKKLQFSRILATIDRQTAFDLEYWLHAFLRRFKISGEWYDALAVNEAMEIIEPFVTDALGNQEHLDEKLENSYTEIKTMLFNLRSTK